MLFDDSVTLGVGAGYDLQLYHNGSTSLITNQNGNLLIRNQADDSDIIFQCDDGSGGETAYLTLDGSAGYTTAQKNIRFADSVEAQFGGIADLTISHNGSNSIIANNTGNLQIKNRADDGRIIFESDDGSGGITEYFRVDGGDGNIKFYKDIINQANANLVMGGGQIKFSDAGRFYAGDSNDLQIYHDGSHSYIKDTGTGNLRIDASDFYVRNSGGTKIAIDALDGAEVALRYDGSRKLETTSTGVDVTGNIAVSGSVQRQISTTHHTFTFGAAGSAAQDYWVPFIGSSEQAAPNVTHRTIAPYGGILKKAIVHSTVAYGSSAQVRFHRIDNGTTSVFVNDNSTDDVTTNVTADMSTAYSSVAFDFTTGNTFSAGDQIGVSFVRDNTGLGDVAITLVWEYELF